MEKKQTKVLIVGIVFVFVVGLFLFLTQKFNSTLNVDDQKEMAESNPVILNKESSPMEKALIPTDVDTSTWKTFQSEDTNIVFKYPANWYINESAFKNTLPDQPLKQITLSNYDQDKVNGSDAVLPPQFIRITVLSFANVGDLATWSKELGFSKPETLRINGMNALRDRHVFRGPSEAQNNERYFRDVTILLNDKIGYELSYGPTNAELANVFDLITASVRIK